ncbi:MAG: hypothetical protein JXR03_20510 [Cyclobacteriaceae bacterium]
MTDQFKIKENGFNEIRKKMILRVIPIALIAGLGGLAISHFNTGGQSSGISSLLIGLPVILGAMAFGLVKGIKRQKNIFNSYTLIINETEIIRQQNLTPDIIIPIREIKEIIKNKEGAFAIKRENSSDAIGIPIQIEKIEELEIRLSSLKEITESDKKSLIQKFPWALPLATVGLMMIVYISTNKLHVGLSGATLTIGLTYSLIIGQKSKHVDRKTKRGMWLTLLILCSVIAITYSKLIA